jgi:hypothetical protein
MSVSRNVLAPGAGFQAARALALLPVRALQTPLGRRIAVAGALIAMLQGAVGVMYSNADDPVAAASAATPAAVTRSAATPRDAPPSEAHSAKAKPKPKAAAKTPEAAATAWYAKKVDVDRGDVRVLQRESVSAKKARVLVMAQTGRDRMDTAVVTVKRDGGVWKVS